MYKSERLDREPGTIPDQSVKSLYSSDTARGERGQIN
jgi:hypothetical protein